MGDAADSGAAAAGNGATQHVSQPCSPFGAAPFTEAYHVAFAATKDEDVSVVRSGKTFLSGLSLYAVADGHNGSAAARHVAAVLPAELERQLGGCRAAPSDVALRQALARAFVAVDAAVTQQFFQSGCTLTAVVVSGDLLTVANVGDSLALLDTGAEVVQLTTDHRIGQNPAEFARLEAAGGRLARLNAYGAGPSASAAEGVGPVRLWPGGIMVARGVGDRDVGAILTPAPHIRQVRLPPTGARLILASDGLWDALPAGRVVRVLRAHASPRAAATQAVTSVAACRNGSFSDDVTVAVVDLLPHGTADFREVCARFGGRLRTALSSPNLSTLVEEALQPREPPAPPPKRGLFACFSKPAVVEAPQNFTPVGSQRGVPRGSGSLHGGSERSMRGGVPRDPSVRGVKRATTVQIVCDVDTAYWAPADFGRPPSQSRDGCSRSSSCSMGRVSPSGVVDGLPFGPSLSSLTSEEDAELQRTLSKGSSLQSASRKLSSTPSTVEKKCHGGNVAAALLAHP